MENPKIKWMRTGGSAMLGNHHTCEIQKMANNLTIRTVPAKSSGLVLNLFILSLFLGGIS
jgi:hypothetical protein